MTYLVECDQGLNDLATGLFRVFAQFEYFLKVRGHCVASSGDAANPDWTRFARELPPLTGSADPGVAEAISYVLGNPPKKQVYANNVLQWRVVAPQAENENDLDTTVRKTRPKQPVSRGQVRRALLRSRAEHRIAEAFHHGSDGGDYNVARYVGSLREQNRLMTCSALQAPCLTSRLFGYSASAPVLRGVLPSSGSSD